MEKGFICKSNERYRFGDQCGQGEDTVINKFVCVDKIKREKRVGNVRK